MAEQHTERTPELLAVRKARWDAGRSARNLAAVHRRVERARVMRRAALTSLAAAACVAFAFVVWPRSEFVAHVPQTSEEPSVAPIVAVASEAERRTVRFRDGSHVELLDAESEVEVVHASAERVEVALTQGRGHFVVEPRPERQFVVRVATLSLEVLGTAFTVQRQPERVHVRVQHGRVAVTAPGEWRVLEADEAAWFDTEPTGDVTLSKEASAEHDPKGARRSARERFLEHARKRRYAHAMAALREKPSLLRDHPEELMLAADAARLSGDAAAAVPYLKRVTEKHSRDARAPLAAFTLGRVYLFDLNRPAEAEQAFALTRKLAARGPLAEDALAREVEAATRAGKHARARELAREYLRTFPEGRRRAELARIAEGP